MTTYDCVIVGGGPAGLTAGIYLARAGLKALILEKETIGGQIASAPSVQNYPGFSEISGAELANNMYTQIEELGVELEIETVVGIQNGDEKKVVTEEAEYVAKTVIIATGAKHRQLGLDVQKKYLGNGVHYCVSCDGAFYKDKTVAVVGGANSAVGNALYLADIAAKVYLIYRGETLKCEKELEKKLREKSNIELLLNTTVKSFNGKETLESITINTQKQERELTLGGLFESIGMDAQTELVNDLLEKNAANYIVSTDCKTSIPGIFVAGDCREKDLRQLTTATADGSIAANYVIKYLKTK